MQHWDTATVDQILIEGDRCQLKALVCSSSYLMKHLSTNNRDTCNFIVLKPRVRTDPGNLESPGKKLLVLESSENLLNLSKKYEV